jgi:hypothetical protein
MLNLQSGFIQQGLMEERMKHEMELQRMRDEHEQRMLELRYQRKRERQQRADAHQEALAAIRREARIPSKPMTAEEAQAAVNGVDAVHHAQAIDESFEQLDAIRPELERDRGHARCQWRDPRHGLSAMAGQTAEGLPKTHPRINRCRRTERIHRRISRH